MDAVILRTTLTRFNWMAGKALNTEFCDMAGEFEPWFADAQTASKHRMDVIMPAIGWLVLANRLYELVYTPKGTKDRSARPSHVDALRDVVSGLNEHLHAPAFNDASAYGAQTVIYPAWQRGGETHSPLPVEGGRFVLLYPHREGVGAQRTTFWAPGKIPSIMPEWLKESRHLTFLSSAHLDGPLSPEQWKRPSPPRGG